MKSIDFPGASLKIGAKQTDVYNVIHAMPIPGPQGEIIACFQLSKEELEQVKETGKIYYSRWTFGQPFQPMRIFTELSDGIAMIQTIDPPY